ncbi:MAG TPA: hypothetical protein VFP21_02745 [Solirubrobacterales bacterium]|nr:hypothetical protein [Solirubrobacterales bacterium]
MADLIEGQVAEVLNSRDLVINRGEENGVKQGMVFEILAPQGQDIRDPETDEVLGSVGRPKVVVKVVEVEAKLAVARTFKSRRRNVGGSDINQQWRRLLEPPRYVTEYDTLKTSERTWEDLSEEESFVKRGDPARQTHKYDDELND